MKKNTKFNSLSELVNEIDSWINILQEKKYLIEELKKNSDAIDDKNGGSKMIEKLMLVNNKLLHSKRSHSSKNEFIPYTINVKPQYYDMVKEEARKADQSISTFLKKKYLYYIINNRDHPGYVKNEYDRFLPIIENLNDKGEKFKSIALALDSNDNYNLDNMRRATKLERSRDLVKLCFAKFVADCKNNRVNDKDYKFISDDIKFKSCDSSNLSGYFYDKAKHILYIEFIGGGVYKYENIPQNVYLALDKAESKGRYFNQFIRDNKDYDYKKVR